MYNVVPLAPVRIWLDTLLRSDVRVVRRWSAKPFTLVQIKLRPLILCENQKTCPYHVCINQ